MLHIRFMYIFQDKSISTDLTCSTTPRRTWRSDHTPGRPCVQPVGGFRGTDQRLLNTVAGVTGFLVDEMVDGALGAGRRSSADKRQHVGEWLAPQHLLRVPRGRRQPIRHDLVSRPKRETLALHITPVPVGIVA